MVRLIIVLLLATALFTVAGLEQHFIQSAYGRLEGDTTVLIARLRETPDDTPIDTDENKELIDHMFAYWLRYERRLTMLARHFDLSLVSDAIIYAKNFIHFDNKEEAMAGLLRLEYLIKTHSFNMGTSIQNVI